uniref:Uncharacterized protein n=1 Tax=Arundo donax TaxID=35708 RepID=A0A0A9EBD0_ARUDO
MPLVEIHLEGDIQGAISARCFAELVPVFSCDSADPVDDINREDLVPDEREDRYDKGVGRRHHDGEEDDEGEDGGGGGGGHGDAVEVGDG